MSVYTEVSSEDLQHFLPDYQAGELLDYAGIRDGVENTNYFVTTTTGQYVLTLFEHMPVADIQFALGLMSRLASQGLPCGRPLSNQQQQFLGQLCGKPASLVTRLNGHSVQQVAVSHCHAVGHVLGHLHLVTHGFDETQPNPRGTQWRHMMAEKISHLLEHAQRSLLADELTYQQRAMTNLPVGIIHADLFRDNVLFEGTELSGLIDLYNAGQDVLLYDLAITATDWCSDVDGQFDMPRLLALIKGYTASRPITQAEQRAWPVLLRRAALRFWLSRLYSLHYPRDGQLTQQKDPVIYQQLLQNYRQNPPIWPA